MIKRLLNCVPFIKRLLNYVPFIKNACDEKKYLNTASFIFSCFYTEEDTYIFYRGMFFGIVLSLVISFFI